MIMSHFSFVQHIWITNNLGPSCIICSLLTQAVEVMTSICRESEASLDYYSLFRAIMKRTPQPMSPLESLASSAVRTAHKVLPQPA